MVADPWRRHETDAAALLTARARSSLLENLARRFDHVVVVAGECGSHCGWQGSFACGPPVDELAVLTIVCSCGGAFWVSGFPSGCDAVGGELSVGVSGGGGGEGLLAGEVAECELGVVVAVAHDVGMVGVAAA